MRETEFRLRYHPLQLRTHRTRRVWRAAPSSVAGAAGAPDRITAVEFGRPPRPARASASHRLTTSSRGVRFNRTLARDRDGRRGPTFTVGIRTGAGSKATRGTCALPVRHADRRARFSGACGRILSRGNWDRTSRAEEESWQGPSTSCSPTAPSTFATHDGTCSRARQHLGGNLISFDPAPKASGSERRPPRLLRGLAGHHRKNILRREPQARRLALPAGRRCYPRPPHRTTTCTLRGETRMSQTSPGDSRRERGSSRLTAPIGGEGGDRLTRCIVKLERRVPTVNSSSRGITWMAGGKSRTAGGSRASATVSYTPRSGGARLDHLGRLSSERTAWVNIGTYQPRALADDGNLHPSALGREAKRRSPLRVDTKRERADLVLQEPLEGSAATGNGVFDDEAGLTLLLLGGYDRSGILQGRRGPGSPTAPAPHAPTAGAFRTRSCPRSPATVGRASTTPGRRDPSPASQRERSSLERPGS